MLIQNDKVLVIFLCLQAELQLFKIIERCCFVQAIEKFFWQLSYLKKSCFSFVAIFPFCKSRKKAFTLSRQSYGN